MNNVAANMALKIPVSILVLLKKGNSLNRTFPIV